jgi:hypothetical protein
MLYRFSLWKVFPYFCVLRMFSREGERRIEAWMEPSGDMDGWMDGFVDGWICGWMVGN